MLNLGKVSIVALLSITVSACGSSNPESVPVSERRLKDRSFDHTTGNFEITIRLDSHAPEYASPEAMKEHACDNEGWGGRGVGSLTEFEQKNERTFVAKCSGSPSVKKKGDAFVDVDAPILIRKDIDFPNFPQSGYTYLSFSDPKGILPGHGFQATFYDGQGRSWLWYPGNAVSVPGEWKVEDDRICFKRGANTYNPVTKTRGGKFKCQDIGISHRLTISRLDGDVFNLASGAIPYRREKCDGPKEFEFDRERFKCRER